MNIFKVSIEKAAMKKTYLTLAIFFICLAVPCKSQILPLKKRNQIEDARKDLEKRKNTAGEGNLFNALQSNDPNLADRRDDFIWSASTASTSYRNAGNIGLSSASRYGLTSGLELQTWLGLDYHAPNIFLKKEISRKKILVSSLHGVYSAWPGFKYVYDGKDTFLADSVSGVPTVISIKNQLLLSRPFYYKLDCTPHQPYLILSASLALDYGISLNDEDIYIERQHLFTPRSISYAGKGLLGTVSVRADWQILQGFYGRCELRSLLGNFISGVTLEQQLSAEYFLLRKVSIEGAYILGYGRFGPHNFSVWPYLNLSFYFGKKQGRERGLFKEQMF
jgi:hypothetical protein